MRTRALQLGATVLLVVLTSAAAHAMLMYDLTGSTSLGTTGDWTGAGLSWRATNIGTGDPYLWHYSYTFDTGLGASTSNLSHFVLELTDDFPDEHVVGISINGQDLADLGWEWAIGDYDGTAQGGSNPNIPGTMWGIKWTTLGDTSYQTNPLTFELWAYHQPEWQDFYAKDGRSSDGTGYNSAWNTGFLDDDPLFTWLTEAYDTDSATDGIQYSYGTVTHLIAPDGYCTPEPGSMMLLGLALGVGFLGKYRRRRS